MKLSIAKAVIGRLRARYARHPCRLARQSLLVSYLPTRHLPGILSARHFPRNVFPISVARRSPRGSQTRVSPETNISPFPALCAEVTHPPVHLAGQSLPTAYLPASGASTIQIESGAANRIHRVYRVFTHLTRLYHR